MNDKESTYSLHNIDNYYKVLNCNICNVATKISELFIEYFKYIRENIKLRKSNFSQFLIIRGLDTIVNVFTSILFNTNNLEMAYFHSQKAFYFYVEFVGQISEDEKMFLQLSSRDAVMYVYKKTIFEINSKVNNFNSHCSEKCDAIYSYIELYKTLLLKIINNDFSNEDTIKSVEIICDKLNGLSDFNKIAFLNEIIEKMYYRIDDPICFFSVCELLCKKIAKNSKQLTSKCLDKFLSDDFDEILFKDEPNKFVNWFLN